MYIDGWSDAVFNDDDWKNAFICRGAGGAFERTDFPPIRVIKRLKAVKISDGVYDDGENEIRLVPDRHCIRKQPKEK